MNEINIGKNHPLQYTYKILKICNDEGEATIIVDINKSYMWLNPYKKEQELKTFGQNWDDVKRLLAQINGLTNLKITFEEKTKIDGRDCIRAVVKI